MVIREDWSARQLSYWIRRGVVNWRRLGTDSRALGTFARALFLARRGTIYLFRRSLELLLFSFGILRVVGLMTFHLFCNMCIAFLAPMLLFGPTFVALILMSIILCFLIVSARSR